MKSLSIGEHTLRYPLIQGGMGVRISGGRLAGAVAAYGGAGVVATAGLALNSSHLQNHNFFSADALALRDEIALARRLTPKGVIGVNCMMAVSDYDETVRTACAAGVDFIVSGAGLPLHLPGLTQDYPQVALVPIVSSIKAAQLIARKWHKQFQRLPDAVVVEDPETAGGHLGANLEDIGQGSYDQYATVRGVKDYFQQQWQTQVPVIAAGGIWDRQDLLHALDQGADGVQLGTRFVCTHECDASPAFKKAYLDARPEDIGLIMSPAGLPGRALAANYEAICAHDQKPGLRCPMGCLKRCQYKNEQKPFCIVHALNRAQQGDTETGLIFCGSNAWKSQRIVPVAEIMAELFAENSLLNAVNS